MRAVYFSLSLSLKQTCDEMLLLLAFAHQRKPFHEGILLPWIQIDLLHV